MTLLLAWPFLIDLLYQSFGVFLAYYLDNDVFTGGTPIKYAFIGGLNFSVAMLMAPVATYTCRRWHFKLTLGVGV